MNAAGALTVVAFSGPSGSGKSTAMKALEATYRVLSERYMELNRHHLDNRLVLSKWAYIQYWFDGVLQARADGATLLLTDRCPLDTCAYVSHGRSALLELLTASMNELRGRNITVRKILVTAPFEVLQARIVARLEVDARRRNYHEADEQHNRSAYDFYSEHNLWDRLVDTSTTSQSDLMALLESTISDLS